MTSQLDEGKLEESRQTTEEASPLLLSAQAFMISYSNLDQRLVKSVGERYHRRYYSLVETETTDIEGETISDSKYCCPIS